MKDYSIITQITVAGTQIAIAMRLDVCSLILKIFEIVNFNVITAGGRMPCIYNHFGVQIDRWIVFKVFYCIDSRLMDSMIKYR